MSIPGFIKSYKAASAVTGHTIATFADPSVDGSVGPAADAVSAPIGVFDPLGGSAGDMVDVQKSGFGELKLGGAVSAGDPIMSDADALGIEAVAASGTTVRIVGYAERPGVSGDIIPIWIAPGLLHEA